MPKTCLTNHKVLISHHITPLVINSLGGGDTHTHTHTCVCARTHTHTDIVDKSNFKKPVVCQPLAGMRLV